MDNYDEEEKQENTEENPDKRQDNGLVGSLNDYHRSFNNLRQGKNVPKNARAAVRGAAKAAQVAARAVQVGARAVGLLARLGPVGWTVLFIIVLMLIILLLSGGGGPIPLGGGGGGNNQPGGGGNLPGGASCPTTSGNLSPDTCHYLNPAIDLFSTSISQEALNAYIEKYSQAFITAGIGDKNEFISRVNYIVASAKQAGLNPALFLGYWKSESFFGTVSTRELGCAGNDFFAQVDCAVGINQGSDPQKYPIPNCARSRDANSVGCQTLKAIRASHPGQDDTRPINYPIATFDDYAEAYGPISDGIGNCTSTYNVLLEVAKELNACVVTPGAPGLGTIPPPPIDIRQGIIDSFAITMNGFDNQHLQWAWEKFWETSTTNFPTLVRGSTIEASAEGLSSQVGCPGSPTTVRLGQYTPGDLFKFILTHELGHAIQLCTPREQSQYNEAMNAYYVEGGVSYYSQTASTCPGTVNVNEDYADIIAYYLNPSAGLASGPKSCGGPANPPNPFFQGTSFPLHHSVGAAVLGGSPI